MRSTNYVSFAYSFRWDWIIPDNSSLSTTCNGDDKSSACTEHGRTFTRLQQEGVTAAWNTPVFPTNPLPNMITMVTGWVLIPLLIVKHILLCLASKI